MFLISLDTHQLIFTIGSLGSIQDPLSTLETPVTYLNRSHLILLSARIGSLVLIEKYLQYWI